MTAFLWRLTKIALVTVVVGYLGVVVVLSYFENKFVYHPTKTWTPPPIDAIRELALDAEGGGKIGAWWLPCPGSDRTILYLHGNGGNLSQRGNSMIKLRSLLNAAVLIVDYPGYGKSDGSPSEAGCYRAADAGYRFLVETETRDPSKLILYGASLGGAVAIDLATRKPHHAVVLVKAFTSAPDVGSKWFPWLPVRWIMRNQFRSIDKLPKLHSPVFIAHGDRDSVVPYEHGRRLFEVANEPKAFFDLPGQDHNDPLPEAFFVALTQFLQAHPETRPEKHPGR